MKSNEKRQHRKHTKWRKELPEMTQCFLPKNLWKVLPDAVKVSIAIMVSAVVALVGLTVIGIVVSELSFGLAIVVFCLLAVTIAVVCGVIAMMRLAYYTTSKVAEADSFINRLTEALCRTGGLDFLLMNGIIPEFTDEDGFLGKIAHVRVDANHYEEVQKEAEQAAEEIAKMKAITEANAAEAAQPANEKEVEIPKPAVAETPEEVAETEETTQNGGVTPDTRELPNLKRTSQVPEGSNIESFREGYSDIVARRGDDTKEIPVKQVEEALSEQSGTSEVTEEAIVIEAAIPEEKQQSESYAERVARLRDVAEREAKEYSVSAQFLHQKLVTLDCESFKSLPIHVQELLLQIAAEEKAANKQAG